MSSLENSAFGIYKREAEGGEGGPKEELLKSISSPLGDGGSVPATVEGPFPS